MVGEELFFFGFWFLFQPLFFLAMEEQEVGKRNVLNIFFAVLKNQAAGSLGWRFQFRVAVTQRKHGCKNMIKIPKWLPPRVESVDLP